MKVNSIVNHKNFIFATRDSGYKSFSSAVAEIVDNSVEAKATVIKIDIEDNGDEKRIIIADNGIGMDGNVLKIAFQFGGTTRHNSRIGNGRYGMGLPNSSLSQARRFDVYSWQSNKQVLWSYLDIDDVLTDKRKTLQEPTVYKFNDHLINKFINNKQGTIVCWNKCDRLRHIKVHRLIKELQTELSRIFRVKLMSGVKILINKESLIPFDPLYLNFRINGFSGKQYGDVIDYQIAVRDNQFDKPSLVKVRFSQFPILEWSTLSNNEKRKYRITQRAGCSVLRSGREIDYGWFFMGTKRKENYDDWWRCEVSFQPELDELFGVTHTKQSINPGERIKEILTPDIENTARELNRRVRDKFIELKFTEKKFIYKIATKNDHLIEKPSISYLIKPVNFVTHSSKKKDFASIKYNLIYEDLSSECLFITEYSQKELTIKINKNHLLFTKILDKIDQNLFERKDLNFFLELIIASMSRAYINSDSSNHRKIISTYNLGWSNILTSLLQ